MVITSREPPTEPTPSKRPACSSRLWTSGATVSGPSVERPIGSAFLAHRLHRIDPRRPAGRQVTGGGADGREQESHAGERDRIACRDLEHERRHETAGDGGNGEADG